MDRVAVRSRAETLSPVLKQHALGPIARFSILNPIAQLQIDWTRFMPRK
jgi:hypothetical protein